MKKDPIDRLFEEKLKDYSEVPDDQVWQNIAASLDKRKKSRMVIPLWWKLGGAAALLALFVYLVAPEGSNPAAEVPVTDTETTAPSGQELPETPASVPPGGREDAVAQTPNEEQDQRPAVKNDLKDPLLPPGQSQKAAQGTAVREQRNPEEPEAIAGQGTETARDRAIQAREMDITPPALPGKEAVQVAGNDQPSGLPHPNAIAVTPQDTRKEAPTAPPTGDGPLPQAAEEVAGGEEAPSGKKSLFEEIAKSQEEEDALAAATSPRWSAGPRIAPVYFNSFGQGSPIHSSFVSNSKSGNVNLSYGLTLSYQISPKLSLRSGVHKVDYGYDTNDISFSASIAAASGQQINNIDYALSSRNLVVRNASQAKAAQDALSAEVAAEFPSRDGRMVQQFGYVEVPLELNLALIDRKLGLHLIGGLSSLFLVDNSVTLESNGSATEMGEANNLNAVNFSTNLGVGLQYEVAPRIQLSLEPVFKYQLNTFSGTDGTFNPYSVGVYSGLNFKF